MIRDLVVLTSRDGAPADGAPPIDGVSPFVDRGGGAASPVIDLPHPNREARARFGRRRRLGVDALVWLRPGDPVPPSLASSYDESFRMTLHAHVGWRPPAGGAVDPSDVVKQVSLLAAADRYGEERFRAHYRHHVEVARRHMPALWQYVQHDVTRSSACTDATKAIVAVSELWFRTEDFLHHYFPSQEDEDRFRSHEGFLDLSRAVSFVCMSHTAD